MTRLERLKSFAPTITLPNGEAIVPVSPKDYGWMIKRIEKLETAIRYAVGPTRDWKMPMLMDVLTEDTDE